MSRGGYRPGAGRPKGSKKKELQPEIDQNTTIKTKKLTPLEYMLKIMNDPSQPPDRRDRMAVAAAPFIHSRQSTGAAAGGKKGERQEAASKAAVGKFQPGAPPANVISIAGGKR